MSLRSSPSLISDSGSLSTLDDPHDILHLDHATRSNTAPSPSIPLFSADNCEIHSIRSRVSKLEEDRSHLEDYATELHNKIQHIQQQRLKMHHTSTRHGNITSSRPIDPKSFDTTFMSTSKLTNQPNTKSSSSHRQYHSLSAVTSTNARGTLPAAPTGNESLKATELAACPQETPVGTSNSHLSTMTPTRRRLQAIQKLFSSEPNPTLLSSETAITPVCKPGGGISQSVRISKTQCTTQDKNGDVLKTPASKVDSVIFMSKLLPLSSSQSKVPVLAAASNCPSIAPIPTIVNLASTPSETNDDTPHKFTRGSTFTKHGDPGLLKSPTSEKSRTPPPPSSMNKLGSKPRNRVSFSNPPHRSHYPEKETLNESERGGREWGSWSKKSSSSSFASSKSKENGSPSSMTPLSALSFLFSKSQVDNSRTQGSVPSTANPKTKRRSLAPQCLRQLMSNTNESSGAGQQTDEPRQTDPPPGNSLSRSHSRQSIDRQTMKSESPTNEKRLSPSRVGSPILRTRASDPSAGVKLERTHSMRTTGKYGQRDKGFSLELARRRTIHPMFSFERPSSTESVLQGSTSTVASIKVDGSRAERDVLLNCVPTAEKQDNTRKKGKLPTVITSRPIPAPDIIFGGQQGAMLDQSTASSHSTRAETARSDINSAGSMVPLIRTRIGTASHGTFAFEPAAAIVFEPRSRPIPGPTLVKTSGNARFPLRLAVVPQFPQRSLLKEEKGKGKSDVTSNSAESYASRQAHLYDEFCQDLKGVLGTGEDWSSFMNYARRYDLGILGADVLLQRVKRLIDGHRSIPEAMRIMLYERFARIVHDNSRI